jgi:hypothetical protein
VSPEQIAAIEREQQRLIADYIPRYLVEQAEERRIRAHERKRALERARYAAAMRLERAA